MSQTETIPSTDMFHFNRQQQLTELGILEVRTEMVVGQLMVLELRTLRSRSVPDTDGEL